MTVSFRSLPLLLGSSIVMLSPLHTRKASCGKLTGVVALGMFYRALSIGTMGVVAPVAALGVAVPVVFGVLRGEQPSAAVENGRTRRRRKTITEVRRRTRLRRSPRRPE